jgi:tRNA modification GTPase
MFSTFSTADTIVAIATPPGRGGIGVVRLSGPEACGITGALRATDAPLEARHATFCRIRSADQLIDQAVVTFFPSPHSYTGDDVVEISAHGSPVILGAIVAAAVANGARLAEPGEFTLRAFLNSRVDLTQAEAVADLIDAVTPLQARVAFDQLEGTLTERIAAIDATLFDLVARLEASIDFPEEGYHFVESGELLGALDALLEKISCLLEDGRRGRLIREGLRVVIVGKPNVGKSSLFNALAGADRAIVTSTPGTTRDLITETVDINGLRVTLVDSAGIRPTDDAVESVGVGLARRAIDTADAVLVVVDGSCPLDESDVQILMETTESKRVVVSNKSDVGFDGHGQFLAVSAKTGAGLEHLRDKLTTVLDIEPGRDQPGITNLRHVVLVERAHDALFRARTAVAERGESLPEELVLADLQGARGALEEISGRRAPDDLLAHIFARFCVGK